ncbi:MAG: hypothetical protein LBN38_04720 [Verrucomicrobiota bacterium]|jgi:hypothetical protein|nr:hypothetical protein [Verrucomicrobiota bacterium]
MMKIVACLLACLFVLLAFAPAAMARESGGVVGFVIGCCFGIRSAAAYNEGKDLHWREWGLIIPLFNWVVSILNGVDGMDGVTSSDLAASYGASYY